MSVQYPNVESVIARIVTDKPVRKTPYQVKGVFMRQYPDETIIPFLDGSYRDKYLYPRVQVKILNEQIYIIGVHEGVDSIISLTEKFDVLDFGNITFEVQNSDLEKNKNQFVPSKRLIRYRFITPWVALNQKTGGRYRFITNQEKSSFLNKLLSHNIVFIANEMGISFKEKVFTKINVSSLFPKPVDENNWGAFMGEFKTNFMLPNYIGIGNGITRGYGSIYGMFNPETFTFDKSGLRKESKNFQPEKIDEEDGKIGAVEVDNIPRSQRRKSPSRQSRKQSQKRFRKNESYHRKSKKVFSDKYNIEEKTKLDNDKYISEDSEDSKFNTEKYHKKQHKT
tara:strand:+ start:576 stop:1589 length:1014 start_codon:yes stop_codon:yes gene_type:complete